MMVFRCCNDTRRAALINSTLNGMDFLEVIPGGGAELPFLNVYFVNNNHLSTAPQFRIDGGARVGDVQITGIEVQTNTVTIKLDKKGDFSTYTLQIIDSSGQFDPLSSAVDFAFHIECLQGDCMPSTANSKVQPAEPEIDYLAKDYASFRRLILDRLSAILPDWQERNSADSGIALVELLAYVGDNLSYRQDAIATEAYLDTARRRTSVRRHVRLVDYPMHEGCNARVWVQIKVMQAITLAKHTPLLTHIGNESASCLPLQERERVYAQLAAAGGEVFETLHSVQMFPEHNTISFYTWGGERCVLPKGATTATLQGRLAKLQPGDVLIIQEVMSPHTGESVDADSTRRHAVRVTNVAYHEDPLGRQLQGLDGSGPVSVTEIEWSAADALPFAVTISAEQVNGEYLPEVSIVLGNIVLADHGRSIATEDLGTVPNPLPELAVVMPTTKECATENHQITPPRYHPKLQLTPLTYATGFDMTTPASLQLLTDVHTALPEIELIDNNGATWKRQRDLLKSNPAARDFTVEAENDGVSWLRFGDNRFGQRPSPGSTFHAKYRIGNGHRGNIGSGAISHVLIDGDLPILEVNNPMPGQGGRDQESLEDIRSKAPYAFRSQQRAVTAADYAEQAQRHEQVQRAGAELRWTGSWYTVFLSIDRIGGSTIDPEFEEELLAFLEPYRRAGHDLEINDPCYVPLEIELQVCVQVEYYRDPVRRTLMQQLSDQMSNAGEPGLFYPDRWTFNQSVYLSPIISAVQKTPGISWVKATRFNRLGVSSGAQGMLEAGEIAIGLHEIARLDNDPNYPEHGNVKLTLSGGANA